MYYSLFFILYSLFFIFITWKNFPWGLYLFFFLLPTYLIRFNIGPLPTTLLEVMLLIIVLVALIKKETRHKIQTNFKYQISKNRLLFFGIILFLLGATISIFTSIDIKSALGEWKAFYIEPILLFLILITTLTQQPKTYNLKPSNFINNTIFALVLSGLITSILAIYQHFTGWLVPYDFWANNDTFRVTAWYGFPNAVGLFLAPLIPLILFLIIQEWNKLKQKNWLLLICYLLSAICYLMAIIYSKGTGPLIGVIAGIGILLLFYKKTRWITLVVSLVGLVSLVSIPQLSNIKQEILFGDRSGQIRLSMWGEATEFLSDHSILGAGLASYQERIAPYHTTVNGEGIEIFHHPHNIFLTMWVNLGLIGLTGFILILIWFFKKSLSKNNLTMEQPACRQAGFNNGTIFVLASMTVIVITGLVDSPYIKNDLSILFWLLPALLLITTYQSQNSV